MQLAPDFAFYVLIGVLARLLAGARAEYAVMASSGLLLSLGLPPFVASAATHAANLVNTSTELNSSFFSGVTSPPIWRTTLLVLIGALLGTLFFSLLTAKIATVVMHAYLCTVGLFMLLPKNAYKIVHRLVRAPLRVTVVGFFSCGGGVFSELLGDVAHGKKAATDALVLVTSLTIVVVFLCVFGFSFGQVFVGLLLGAFIASPILRGVRRTIPQSVLTGGVASLLIALSCVQLLQG